MFAKSVEFVTVRPAELAIPPPESLATFDVNVLFVMVAVPKFRNAPPFPAEFPVNVDPDTVIVLFVVSPPPRSALLPVNVLSLTSVVLSPCAPMPPPRYA